MFASNSSASSSPAASTADSTPLLDQAADAADQAVKATQRVTADALDRLASAVQALRAQAEPLLDGAANQANSAAHHGLNALHDSSASLRHSARRASEQTVGYIRQDPVKSMLVAAATGAVLMGLISLMRGTSRRD